MMILDGASPTALLIANLDREEVPRNGVTSALPNSIGSAGC